MTKKQAARERIAKLIKFFGVLRRDEVVPRLEAITRATAADKERIANLDAWQADVQEREGACCPEDVGFDEYIGRLERRLAAKTQECEGLRDLNEQLFCEIQGPRDSARKEGE